MSVQTGVVNIDEIERKDELENIINAQTDVINEMRKELLTLKDKLKNIIIIIWMDESSSK